MTQVMHLMPSMHLPPTPHVVMDGAMGATPLPPANAYPRYEVQYEYRLGNRSYMTGGNAYYDTLAAAQQGYWQFMGAEMPAVGPNGERATVRIVKLYGITAANKRELITTNDTLITKDGIKVPGTNSFRIPWWWSVLSTASMAACAFHGYRRNKSVGWALAWGLAGAVFPVITPTIALAQGFGKRK